MRERAFGVLGVILILAGIIVGIIFYVNGNRAQEILRAYPTGDDAKDKALDAKVTPVMLNAAKMSKSNKEVISKLDEKGMTPLHVAVSRGDLGMIKLLLAQRADVDAQDSSGKTPLHYAAIGNQANVAKLLITYGADINTQDSSGYTPLHYADENSLQEVGEVLRQRGGLE